MKYIAVVLILAAITGGCATSITQVQRWERTGNITKLSKAARQKSEDPYIRKKSLESLARLNWNPSNAERLEVYGLFAPPARRQAVASLTQTISSEAFAQIDRDVVECSGLLNTSGDWQNPSEARRLYGKLSALDKNAAAVSLCQQVVARPGIRTKILLLAIKLGIPGSEDDLNAVLLEYGDKAMAEDYLNSGSDKLHDGAAQWGRAHGYCIATGIGSHRSNWGRF